MIFGILAGRIKILLNEWRYQNMKVGFGGGVIVGALVGAAISLMAEENFNINRSLRAMNRAGRNISRSAGRIVSSISRMI